MADIHSSNGKFFCDCCSKEVEEVFRSEGLSLCEKCVKREHVNEFMDWLKYNYYDDLWEEYCHDYLATYEDE